MTNMQVKCPSADGLAHRPGFGPAYRVTVGNRWHLRPDLHVRALESLAVVERSRTSCGLPADWRGGERP
jgi:hypothetical protein